MQDAAPWQPRPERARPDASACEERSLTSPLEYLRTRLRRPQRCAAPPRPRYPVCLGVRCATGVRGSRDLWPWTDTLWVYDLRTNRHLTQKQSPITRRDFGEFVACYRAGEMHQREATWSESNPDGRWRSCSLDEIQKRDTLSLDLFWIKDQSLTDTDALPPPDVIATEIAEELEAAFDLFSRIARKLPKSAG